MQTQLEALGLSDGKWLAAMADLARLRSVAKNEVVIEAGQIPTYFYMVLAGTARYYYLSPNGKEWNKAFFREGQLIGSLSSYLKRQPCTYTIAAVEHCQLAALPVSVFDDLSETGQPLQGLLNRYIREIMLRNEEREALLLTCNSEARYRWLIEHQGWLVSRVAQYHLASYLGIEPASLSRIKRHVG